MGRGRAKAKQTKVARELKYRSFDMDVSSLERELQTGADGHYVPPAYADLVAEDDEDDEADEDEFPAPRAYEDLRKSG